MIPNWKLGSLKQASGSSPKLRNIVSEKIWSSNHPFSLHKVLARDFNLTLTLTSLGGGSSSKSLAVLRLACMYLT